MATKKQELEPDERWKARYYEVLEELEGRQKEWQEAVQLLEGVASQLARATDSQASDLATILSELQRDNADADGTGEFQSHINVISQRLVELYHQSDSGSAVHPANVFIDILEKLELPAQLVPDFRLLKKNIKSLAWQDEGSEASAIFMNIMHRLLHDDEELIRPTRRQKLISRLLARASQPETTVEKPEQVKQVKADRPEADVQQRYIAPAVGELLLQLALRMPDEVKRKINFATLKRHTNKARRRKDLIPIIDVIAQQIEFAYQTEQNIPVLLKNESVEAIASAISPLFEQLEPPVDLKPRIAELELKFTENKDDVDTLVYCLNSLNEIVAELSRRFAHQRDELEHYLSEAVDQYHALDDELQRADQQFEQRAGNDKSIADAIQQEIAELKNSVEGSENLQETRTQILEQLDSLQQRASELTTGDNESEDASVNLLHTLKGRLNEMEGASADLRNKLDEFRQQSIEDVLTGIPNRYAYEKQLATEIARCRRYGSTLSLVVWRVSQLKDVVKSYGHAAGDKILQVVATRLSEDTRATDFVARYGSDVFVTLMTETALDDAVNVAAKLCEQIEQVPFMYHDIQVPLSMAAGVAQYQDKETANSLFERADQAFRNVAGAETGRTAAAD